MSQVSIDLADIHPVQNTVKKIISRLHELIHATHQPFLINGQQIQFTIMILIDLLSGLISSFFADAGLYISFRNNLYTTL